MTRLLTSTWFRTALIVLALMCISELTGFGDWIKGYPVAVTTLRAIITLLMGAAGLFGLIAPPRDGWGWQSWRYRALALVLLAIATIHASILFGDPLGLTPA